MNIVTITGYAIAVIFVAAIFMVGYAIGRGDGVTETAEYYERKRRREAKERSAR